MSAVITNPPLQIPAAAPLMGKAGWGVFFTLLAVLLVVVPVLNLVVPAGSVFHLSDFAVNLMPLCCCSFATKPALVATTALPISNAS
jgi:urea transport system permease protein